MMRLGEEEAEAELVDRLARSAPAASSSPKPSASSTSAAPVADEAARLPCFATPRPRRRGDECCGRRDVQGVRAVAAGAGRVDEVVALRSHGQDVLAHRLGAACDLVGRLALEPQRDEEAADLRRVASPDMIEFITPRASSRVRSWPSSSRRERRLDHAPSRKFRASCGPVGVSTDSGWNCTPSTRSSRWRTAITSPSAAVAETSRQSGTEVAASEW